MARLVTAQQLAYRSIEYPYCCSTIFPSEEPDKKPGGQPRLLLWWGFALRHFQEVVLVMCLVILRSSVVLPVPRSLNRQKDSLSAQMLPP